MSSLFARSSFAVYLWFSASGARPVRRCFSRAKCKSAQNSSFARQRARPPKIKKHFAVLHGLAGVGTDYSTVKVSNLEGKGEPPQSHINNQLYWPLVSRKGTTAQCNGDVQAPCRLLSHMLKEHAHALTLRVGLGGRPKMADPSIRAAGELS